MAGGDISERMMRNSTDESEGGRVPDMLEDVVSPEYGSTHKRKILSDL